MDAVAGLDEAGRGPLAGPVFAAAVILPSVVPAELSGLRDSKKLSAAARDRLYDLILLRARAWGIGEASVEEIGAMNILNASLLAMRRAFSALAEKPGLALVDGNQDPGLGVDTRLIIGGDASEACISAASILAKVARDRRMLELHRAFPQYGFDRHKGYGTREHQQAILEHGPSPVHRPLFLRKLLRGAAA